MLGKKVLYQNFKLTKILMFQILLKIAVKPHATKIFTCSVARLHILGLPSVKIFTPNPKGLIVW